MLRRGTFTRSTTDSVDSTGITGYIAGDAFYAIHKAHPDYKYVALIRTEEKAGKVRAAYPDVRVVIGGLDDSAIIEEESAKADIVLRNSSPFLYWRQKVHTANMSW